MVRLGQRGTGMESSLSTGRRPEPERTFHLAQSTLKKIHAVIRAYYVIGRSATLEEVRSESRQSYEAVRNTQSFLEDMGILMRRSRGRRLRPLGMELGKAIKSRKGDAAVNQIWKRIVCNNAFCLGVLKDARAEGKLDKNRFVYLVFTAAGYRARELSHDYTTGTKALISIFKRSGFVRRSNEYLLVGKSIEQLLEKQRKEIRETEDYISQEDISYLDKIYAEGCPEFDLSKLLSYCHELNDNYRRGNTLSVMILAGAILQHIPPVFGEADFESMASHVTAAEFREAARRLLALSVIGTDRILKGTGGYSLPSGLEAGDFRSDLNFVMDRLLERLTEAGRPNLEQNPGAGGSQHSGHP